MSLRPVIIFTAEAFFLLHFSIHFIDNSLISYQRASKESLQTVCIF